MWQWASDAGPEETKGISNIFVLLIQNPTKLKFCSKIICYQESYLFMYFNFITLCNFCFIQEQLESAQKEIAMGNERERQLQSKLLKTKEELKLEREEVNTCIQFMKRFQVEYRSWNTSRCIPWLKRSIDLGWNKPCSGHCESSWEQTQMDLSSSHRGAGSAMFLVVQN